VIGGRPGPGARRQTRTGDPELRNRDAVGRFGGEEFAAVLAGVGADEAVTVAERICAALREVRVGEVRVTASVGVAHHRAGLAAVTVEALLARAAAALYAAKRQGRNQVRVGALVDSM
jgi:diguanylate cyclase (GGDEF)-like protein